MYLQQCTQNVAISFYAHWHSVWNCRKFKILTAAKLFRCLSLLIDTLGNHCWRNGSFLSLGWSYLGGKKQICAYSCVTWVHCWILVIEMNTFNVCHGKTAACRWHMGTLFLWPGMVKIISRGSNLLTGIVGAWLKRSVWQVRKGILKKSIENIFVNVLWWFALISFFV